MQFEEALKELKTKEVFIKRKVIGNLSVVIWYKNRLYTLGGDGVRYNYTLSNKDLSADDWEVLTPEDICRRRDELKCDLIKHRIKNGLLKESYMSTEDYISSKRGHVMNMLNGKLAFLGGSADDDHVWLFYPFTDYLELVKISDVNFTIISTGEVNYIDKPLSRDNIGEWKAHLDYKFKLCHGVDQFSKTRKNKDWIEDYKGLKVLSVIEDEVQSWDESI
jgi:hypothetical protein